MLKRLIPVLLILCNFTQPVFSSPHPANQKMMQDRTEILHGGTQGIGINRTYYSTGALKSEYFFQTGLITSFRRFDEEGHLLWDSKIPNWFDRTDTQYYPDGTLMKETIYKYNKILSEKEYGADGSLRRNFKRDWVNDE